MSSAVLQPVNLLIAKRYGIHEVCKLLGIRPQKLRKLIIKSVRPLQFSLQDIIEIHLWLGWRKQPTLTLPLRPTNGNSLLGVDPAEFDVAYRQRIEMSHGKLPHFFPFLMHVHVDDPRHIMLAADINFGEPVLSGTGISSRIVYTRFKAGESIHELSREYECRPDRIEAVIRWEARGIMSLHP